VEITVTDANLILGRLDAAHFLGGQMALDLSRTEKRMQHLARRLGQPLENAAWGVVRVANSNMERAMRTISVERGHDPRRFTLVAFGGAGPLHACELASALRIPRVLIPPSPGVLSALGMIVADVVRDYSQTVMLPAERADAATLLELLAPLDQRARVELCSEGWSDEAVTFLPSLDMRYVGQSYELTVEIGDWGAEKTGPAQETIGQPAAPGEEPTDQGRGGAYRFIEAFHEAHRRRFSYASEGEPVEIVNLRLKAVARTAKPQFSDQPPGDIDPRPAHIGHKSVLFAEGHSSGTGRPLPAALYDRGRLTAGNVIVGPAVVFQLDTTSVIPPGWVATVDGWQNLVLEWRGK
jgi:N-methylhydantoinase A